MAALYSFLFIIFVSVIIIRIGATSYELTGLSSDVSMFQAQSAFSGVGFTTEESEVIVNHPVRRRITRILILLGSAGLTSSIATLILTFTRDSDKGAWLRLSVLVGGLGAIYIFSRSKIIKLAMKKFITKILDKLTSVRVYDYEQMLGFNKGYTISRIHVKPQSWCANRLLKELELDLEGLVVLAIRRESNGKEKFIGAPKGQTMVKTGDVIICYSKEDVSRDLSQRIKGRSGDAGHHEKVHQESDRSKRREISGGYDE
jgi:hypothetical protein